jgi:hypothetical protein
MPFILFGKGFVLKASLDVSVRGVVHIRQR